MPSTPVRAVIEALIRKGQPFSSGVVARTARVSRQAAHKALQAPVREGRLVREGSAGRGARYALPGSSAFRFRYRREGLAEDYVASEVREKVPFVRALKDPARSVFEYALAEMVNNAVDHSRGHSVDVAVSRRGRRVILEVIDDGVGLFAHLQRARGLASPLEAVAEVSKGKVTTDPDRHTGEGLFFTSRAVTAFDAESTGVRWIVDNTRGDQSAGAAPARRGTRIHLEIDPPTVVPLKKVFDHYTHDLAFDTTEIRVRLFETGDRFVSRSEARRLMRGLERFRTVTLDFRGVRMVGQGFADEVFRVWQMAHPDVTLRPEGMIAPVRFFVDRARALRARRRPRS